jgi:hypothetical protein
MKRQKKAASRKRKSLPDDVARLVWIRAAGICSRPGCGRVLHEEPQLLRPQRFGELAHNVGAQPDGPRGDSNRSAALAADPQNLILLCPTCHTLIDKNQGKDYPESLLRAWKQDHERNVRLAGALTSGRRAVPVLFSGPIAGQIRGIDPTATLTALRDDGLYPVTEPQSLELPSGVGVAGDADWWKAHTNTLGHQIQRIVHLPGVDEFPLALFPLAEMPLLMLLGHLLGDKRRLMPFQYSRATGTWSFVAPAEPPAQFSFNAPSAEHRGQEVALVLSLTASIDPQRVYSAVGRRDIPIIELSTPTPGTGLVRNRRTIESFQLAARNCLDAVERAVSDPARTIHVFPAMPAPLAVAFGAAVMPKVSNPLLIYDARGVGGAFTRALTLPA